MADYNTNQFDRPVNKIAAEAGELSARRITANQNVFTTGGVIMPTQNPKVEHKAHFESAGTQFTVAEIQQGLIKIGAKHPAKFAILSWADFFDPDMKYETSKDAQVCVVTWEN